MPNDPANLGDRMTELVTAGKPEKLASDRPLRLDAYGGVFAVRSGYVDLFAVATEDGEPVGARRHILRVAGGGIVCGFPAMGSAVIIAVGGLDNEIQHLDTLEALTMPTGTEDAPLDRWIAGMTEAAFGAAPAWPEVIAQPGQPVDCAEGARLHGGRGVVWACDTSGDFGVLDGDEPARGALPLTGGFFLRARTPATCTAQATGQMAMETLLDGLVEFHRLAAGAIAKRLEAHDLQARERLTTRRSRDSRTMARALSHLARVGHRIESDLDLTESTPLVTAFAAVSQRLGVPSSAWPRGELHRMSLPELARLSGFGLRRVLLRDGWWEANNGPLIAHLEAGHVPVALLPHGRSGYRMHDGDREIAVTAETAATLEAEAVTLYRPVPKEVESLPGLAKLIVSGGQRDLATVVAMGILASVLAAILPIGTGFLFEWVVPHAELQQMAAVIGGLVVAAIAGACFELVKAIALVRLEARMEATLQPLAMQRLLSLPVAFFRNFGTGDLTDRVLAIQRIRHLVAGTTIVSLLAGAFASVSFAVILIYSPLLALLSVALVAGAGLITVTLSILQLRNEREAVRLGGREDGLVLQFIQGISKLRVAAAEPRMFGLWAGVFTQRRTFLVRGQRFANLRATFLGAYPIIASLLLFKVAAGSIDGGRAALSLGAFLAINAAFGQLLAAMTSGSAALAGTLGAIPLFERLRPIVTTPPEARADKVDPGPLTGPIEINRVTFRYAPDTPSVVEDVSLRIEPGQFVAIVGPSGSGKSTLSRLLLGFEVAESGDILFQGQSIANLDTSALRRRIGVVLQSAKIMSGSIFENITAGLPYSLEEAWEAARLAGVADDIEAMPMGMHSVLMEGASTLSGGQVQRLMIARALIGKPQVLILDEATSALDNVSQAVVTESLNRLHATRIVIAHRLTTIREADRIFVMERGRLIESGTFDSLMTGNGTFAALARRQLL
jgi:NHLM bacteriocin system ABC transporter ATP-binding protein